MNKPEFNPTSLYEFTERCIEQNSDVELHNSLLAKLEQNALVQCEVGKFSACISQHDTVGVGKGTKLMLVRTLTKKGFEVNISDAFDGSGAFSLWVKWENR